MLEQVTNQIENIVIFVCDSLRWDFAPERVLGMGESVKTVASSLYTGSSFPSIVSGLYPPRHGVSTWEDLLPMNRRGLLEFEGHQFSLWCETSWTDLPPDESAIHEVLGNPSGVSLSELQPPFIYIEDDNGGHCPYGLPSGEFGSADCPDFFRAYGRLGREALVQAYARGIEQSVARFEQRLKLIEQRGLLERTLVIFTSDHGELLGEYGGLTGHGRPPCPELVYVPTVFIHPSLHKGTRWGNGVMRHVDLCPTLAGIINYELPYKPDGLNLLDEPALPETGFNFKSEGYLRARSRIAKYLTYDARSVWEEEGGHVFHNLSRLKGLALFLRRFTSKTNPESWYMQEYLGRAALPQKLGGYAQALKHLTAPYLKYGTPRQSPAEARSLIAEYIENVEPLEKEGRPIEEDVVLERLKDLGYVD